MAVHRLRLSGRSYDRLLRVGRTIADLEDSSVVCARHLAEAIQFRPGPSVR
jgi:magnesium chelatase family protein